MHAGPRAVSITCSEGAKLHCTTSSWHANAATTIWCTCRILYRTTSSEAGSVASNLHCVIASAVLYMASATPCRAMPGSRRTRQLSATSMDYIGSWTRVWTWLHESQGVHRALTKDVLVEHAPHGSQCTAGYRACEHRRAGSRPHACSACPNSLASQTISICCHAGECGLARGAPEVSGLRMTSRKGAMYSSGCTALQSATKARQTPS